MACSVGEACLGILRETSCYTEKQNVPSYIELQILSSDANKRIARLEFKFCRLSLVRFALDNRVVKLEITCCLIPLA